MSKRIFKNTTSKDGTVFPLLAQFPVNDHFQIAIYQGRLSRLDIIIKYKQLVDGDWTPPRMPKHIHWAVDILIKQHEEPEATQRFLDFLLEYWKSVTPLLSEEERARLLSTGTLLEQVDQEALQYPELAGKGEYSVKFLILLAKLLMVQEKTNRKDAYMFKKLLEDLKAHKDIFSVVRTATMHGKKND